MKNTDKTIPYEPSPAELARFRTHIKTISFNSNQVEEEEIMAGKLNVMNVVIIPAVIVILVVTLLLLMGTWDAPASLTTVSWNG